MPVMNPTCNSIYEGTAITKSNSYQLEYNYYHEWDGDRYDEAIYYIRLYSNGNLVVNTNIYNYTAWQELFPGNLQLRYTFNASSYSSTPYDNIELYCQYRTAQGNEFEEYHEWNIFTPPSDPTLNSQNGTSVTMSWTAGTGNLSYWLYDATTDTTYGSKQTATSVTFTIPTSMYGTSHSWQVLYYVGSDIAGHTSGRTITLSTPALGDVSLKINGTTEFVGKDIVLSWNAPTKTAISGTVYYDVYIGGTKHNGSSLTTTGYTVNNATSYSSRTTIYVKATITGGNVTLNKQSNNVYFTYSASAGYKTVKWVVNGVWTTCIPYAVVNNQWVPCDPYVCVNTSQGWQLTNCS